MYLNMLSRQEIHALLPELLAAAKKERPFSLLLMKPADFNLIQMQSTPTACDKILKSIAARVFTSRPYNAKAGHWSGTTFALLLPNCNRGDAEYLAQEISLNLTRDTATSPSSTGKVSLIYAAAEAPPRSLSQIGLNAEKALAKEEGRFLPFLKSSYSQEVFLKDFLDSFLLANDGYLFQHSRLSAMLAAKLTVNMRLKTKEREYITLAASIADIGMLLGGEGILLLPRPISIAEYLVIKKHPRFAANLARSIGLSEEIAQAVFTHHERWDGGGYPLGTSGEEIPLLGRILGLCTAYAALLMPRPYRRAIIPTTAREILVQNAGKAFDPQLVKLGNICFMEAEKQLPYLKLSSHNQDGKRPVNMLE